MAKFTTQIIQVVVGAILVFGFALNTIYGYIDASTNLSATDELVAKAIATLLIVGLVVGAAKMAE